MLFNENLIIKKSYRARRIRLTVSPNGSVVLTQPFFLSTQTALSFAKSKSEWIDSALAKHKKANILPIPKPSKKDFEKYKREARLLVLEKIRYWNQHYNFSFAKVSIKNQKTRWGSCSKNRNLNFSYRIIFLPEHLQDYLIVHELCHLSVFSHSREFWSLVKEKIPVSDILEFKKRVR